MSQRVLAGPMPTLVTLQDLPGDQSGLAIQLAQDSSDPGQWHFRVHAHTDSGSVYVGEFVTAPVAGAGAGSRNVAVAGCPGAIAWDVEVLAVPSGQRGLGVPCEVTLASSPAVAKPGLRFPHERWSYATGVDGVCTLPAGARVLSIATHTTQAGSTVQVGAGPAITVPQNGAIQLEPGSALKALGMAQLTVTFTNTDGYTVEYLEV